MRALRRSTGASPRPLCDTRRRPALSTLVRRLKRNVGVSADNDCLGSRQSGATIPPRHQGVTRRVFSRRLAAQGPEAASAACDYPFSPAALVRPWGSDRRLRIAESTTIAHLLIAFSLERPAGLPVPIMPTTADPDTPHTEIARYRAGTAGLLAQSISTTRDLERSLDVNVGTPEFAVRSDLEGDPAAPFRYECALLLRKARLHSDAAQRANATNNLHSLAVQMRPILECAGQVVFILDHLGSGGNGCRERGRRPAGVAPPTKIPPNGQGGNARGG